jgi:hypothetical protein
MTGEPPRRVVPGNDASGQVLEGTVVLVLDDGERRVRCS